MVWMSKFEHHLDQGPRILLVYLDFSPILDFYNYKKLHYRQRHMLIRICHRQLPLPDRHLDQAPYILNLAK